MLVPPVILMSLQSTLFMVWTGCLQFLSYFFVIAGIFTFWLLSSPILIVIKGDVEEEESFLSFLQSHYFPPRLTIMLYLVQPFHPQYQRFPMNFLRSLGISNVETTHYLVLDIDLHPTGIHVSTFSRVENLYSELLSLPSWLQKDNKSAVILPIFFLNGLLDHCDSVPLCAYL